MAISISFLLFLLSFHHRALASTEGADSIQKIVVTATRLKATAEQVASSVTVISSEELEQKKTESIAGILESVPGLRIVRSGGPGSPVSAILRGANAEHTLVLIDGVRMNDPLSPSRSFDFGTLTLEGLERIEVIRGPESVLYGSDAVGGVIHLITKKGSGTPTGSFGLGYGSYRTTQTWTTLAGSAGSARYSVGGRFENTSGYSAANKKFGNTEADGRSAASANARLGFEPLKNLPADLTLQFSDSRFDNDSSGGPGGDDPDYQGTERKLTGAMRIQATHFDEWEPIANFSYVTSIRTARKTPNTNHPFPMDTEYESKRGAAELQNNLFLSDQNTLVLGITWDRESGRARENMNSMDVGANSIGTFTQHQFTSDNFFATLGARWDHHERFGGHATYRLAPGYSIPATGTRLRASFGTGFRAPSLYQLFSSYGDPQLQPEKSSGFDFSIDQSLAGGKLRATWTLFDLRLWNLTQFEPALNRFQNLGSASTKGLETSVEADLTQKLKSVLTYTFTHAKDGNGLPLYRRTRHQGSLEVTFEHLDFNSAFISRVVGPRDDLDALVFTRKRLPGYWTLDFRASQKIRKTASKLLMRIENALDRDYQEVDGYGTAGRTLTIAFQQGF